MIYKNRIIKLPEKANFFILGVRGSGKTALLKRRFPKAFYMDLLDQGLYQRYLLDVSLFYKDISSSKEEVVIVDEIQRMPRFLNEIHRLIESSSRRFILTGSSARQLKKPGVNLLAGRVGFIDFHPFVPEELGEEFDLDKALQYGLLPVVYSARDKVLALKTYAQTYLKEEIKAEALVRNLPGFARFLEVAAVSHGQVVNMSAISRDCQVSRSTVQDFFSILEDTKLGFFLRAYTPKLSFREKKHSKFYFIDPGLVRSLKNQWGSVSVEEKGFLFEGLVVQILRAYKDYSPLENPLYDSIFYWSIRGSKKTEVDILLQKKDKLIAIEVKSKPHISSQDYKGLHAIKDLKGLKKRIVVYLGPYRSKTEEGIEVWPFSDFCKMLEGKQDFEFP